MCLRERVRARGCGMCTLEAYAFCKRVRMCTGTPVTTPTSSQPQDKSLRLRVPQYPQLCNGWGYYLKGSRENH